MTSFRDDPTEWQRLDYTLMRNGPVVMYFRPAVLHQDLGWLTANGYSIDTLDSSRWQDAGDMHSALSSALAFPEHFGRNLDALADCLSDLRVPDGGGRALLLQGFDVFAAAQPDVAQALVDILATEARRFLLFGRRFLVLLHSFRPDLRLSPVGACPVLWNPREFLDSSRSI